MPQQRADLTDAGTGQFGDRRQCLAALLHPCNRRRGFRAVIDTLAVGLSANLVARLGQPLASQASTSMTLPTATTSVAASSTFARSRCARVSLARACASRTRRRASTFEVFPAMTAP